MGAPPRQTIAVREPIRLFAGAPQELVSDANRQARELAETVDALERALYEAEEVAKREGFVQGVLYALRADRKRTIEALHMIAAANESSGHAERANGLRQAADLLTPAQGR